HRIAVRHRGVPQAPAGLVPRRFRRGCDALQFRGPPWNRAVWRLLRVDAVAFQRRARPAIDAATLRRAVPGGEDAVESRPSGGLSIAKRRQGIPRSADRRTLVGLPGPGLFATRPAASGEARAERLALRGGSG